MWLNNNINESPHSKLDALTKTHQKNNRLDIRLQLLWKQLFISPHNLSGSIISTFLFLLASVFIFPFKKFGWEFCGRAGEPELKTEQMVGVFNHYPAALALKFKCALLAWCQQNTVFGKAFPYQMLHIKESEIHLHTHSRFKTFFPAVASCCMQMNPNNHDVHVLNTFIYQTLIISTT